MGRPPSRCSVWRCVDQQTIAIFLSLLEDILILQVLRASCQFVHILFEDAALMLRHLSVAYLAQILR
jgi:hypothetical protein